jgi:hypothetical protein
MKLLASNCLGTKSDGRLEIEQWHSCKSSSESTGFEALTRLDCTASDGESPRTQFSSVPQNVQYRRFERQDWFILHCRNTNGPLVPWRQRQQSWSNCCQITRHYVIVVFMLTVETKSVQGTRDCPPDGGWVKWPKIWGCHRMYVSTNISEEGLHSSWMLRGIGW